MKKIFFLLFISIKSFALTLPTNNTAIVVIDIWNKKFLDKLVIDKINPFLQKAKSKGYLIIYSPSQGIENKNLINISDYKVYGYEELFPILEKYHIKNIIYIGYDKLLCMLDKPSGIFHLKYLGFQYNNFVIEDLSLSLTKEMNLLSKYFFKILQVSEIKSNNIILSTSNTSTIPYPKKTNKTIKYSKLSGNIPLVLLYKHTNNDFKNIEKILKSKNIRYISIINNNLTSQDLLNLISKEKITDIIWGGYYADTELIFNNTGISSMYIKKRYYNVRIPKMFILDELFFIKNNFLYSEDTKRVLINHYRNINLISLNHIFKKDINSLSKNKNNTNNILKNDYKLIVLLLIIFIIIILIYIKSKKRNT